LGLKDIPYRDIAYTAPAQIDNNSGRSDPTAKRYLAPVNERFLSARLDQHPASAQ
jgi:hypothetical protein